MAPAQRISECARAWPRASRAPDDLDVARAEVLAELRALWDALARRPASAPRIVRLDTGMSLSPDTLSERDLD